MKIIIANWKKYLSKDESVKLAEALSAHEISDDILLFVAPDEDARDAVGAVMGGSVRLASQDEAPGVAIAMVGHSDMRKAGDTDKIIVEKIKKCISNGVIPVLCVGENEEERADGRTNEVVSRQLKALNGVSSEVWIAYEPLWAIGTDKTPSADEIRKEAQSIGMELQKMGILEYKVLYGGSVDATNAGIIVREGTVQGLLIGRSSTTLSVLMSVINNVSKS